jgi:outer membrane biosynthesis protein TonB
MNSIRLSSFVWTLTLSAIAHGLAIWLLPSPIKLGNLNSKPKRISIVRVVSLPNLKSLDSESDLNGQLRNSNKNIISENLIKNSSDSSEKLAPNLNQTLSTSPLPNQRPLSTLNTDVSLPKIAMGKPELPENAEKIEPKPKLEPKESKQVESQKITKTEQKIESNPTPEPKLESNPESKPNLPPQKKAIATSIPNPTPNDSTSRPPAFTSTLSRIYQDYGTENLVPRLIAPREALVDPDKREPGISWIVPNTQTKQTGTVTIVLIVAPDGKVEQELINDADPAELREIAQQTVKGYYEKFQPIELKWQGKYRLVTIRFEFP